MIVLLLSACLERVTGTDVPLDPRFYEAVEATQGDPGQGAGGRPFTDYTGETVTIRGIIVAENLTASVDLGVRIPDPSEEGGIRNEGKYLLDAAGPFEIVVPLGIGRMELEALQDPDQDGPSAQDPYASVWLNVGEKDLNDVELLMEAGAFGAGGPTHTEAPPGAPGGDPSAAPSGGGGGAGSPSPASPGAPGGDPSAVLQAAPDGEPTPAPPGSPGGDLSSAPAPNGAGDLTPFVGYDGDTVTVSGTLRCAPCMSIDLDLFQPNPDRPWGRELLGKLKLAPGAYSLVVPADFGPMLLEAFSDLDGNGPGEGDPMGIYDGNPLRIGSQDITGIDVTLGLTEDGRMPGNRQPSPQQQRPSSDR